MKKKKAKKEKSRITGKMMIGEIVSKYPEAVGVLLAYGLHCIGCRVSLYETLEDGASAHGIRKKQFDEMLKKVNKLCR